MTLRHAFVIERQRIAHPPGVPIIHESHTPGWYSCQPPATIGPPITATLYQANCSSTKTSAR